MFAKRILSLAMISAVMITAGLAVTSSQAQDKPAFDEKQTQAIETIIRGYLLKNPEVLREAIGELNKRQEAEAAEKRKGALASLYKQETPYSTGTGKVTVVEFFDYNCPYCTQAFKEVVKVNDADKDIRIVFVEFPILSEESRKASEAAVASAKQNKYWEFHRALMSKPGPATEEKALKVAAEIGLDVERLKKDMESPETAEVLEKNLALGQSMGVQGTPAFFVGDEAIPGAPENLNKILSAAIQQTRAKGCSVC